MEARFVFHANVLCNKAHRVCIETQVYYKFGATYYIRTTKMIPENHLKRQNRALTRKHARELIFQLVEQAGINFNIAFISLHIPPETVDTLK